MQNLFLKLFFVITLTAIPNYLSAQEIKGTVVNEQNEPLSFANIIALTNDSIMLFGAAAFAGALFLLVTFATQ